MTNHDDAHVVEFEGRDEEPDRDMIEPPALEPAVPGVMDSTWAEEMDREHGYTLQGEYIQNDYPPVPSPAAWHPKPPTMRYQPPPQTCYTPPHTWYRLPRTHYKS